MKIIIGFAMILSAVPLYAGSTQTINAPCEKAITKAMVLSAHRKWSPSRPDPTAPVLNIKTHANYGKVVLIGGVFSHEKNGELVFDDEGSTCSVTSNGHPADVILSDLVTTYESAKEAAAVSGKETKETVSNEKPKEPKESNGGCRNPNSVVDCHGNLVQ